MLRRLPHSARLIFGVHNLRHVYSSEPFKETKGQFFYVIPEIPTDNPLKNPILNHDSLPSLDAIKAKDLFTGISKLIMEYQVSLSQFSENIKNGNISPSFSDLVGRLDEIMFPIRHSMQLIEGFGVIHDDAIWRLISGRLISKVLQAQSEHLFSDAAIFEALNAVFHQLSSSEIHQKGVIEQLLAEGWSCGAGLSAIIARKAQSCETSSKYIPNDTTSQQAQKRFADLQCLRAELTNLEKSFEFMVANSAFVSTPGATGSAQYTGRYADSSEIGVQLPNYLTNLLSPESNGQIPVAESDLAASAPAWLPQALGGKREGGYFKDMRVNLGVDSTANLFLRHCSNRDTRRMVWTALVQRAGVRAFGGASGQHASNDDRIEHIRKLRSQVATYIGAPDWLSAAWQRTAAAGRGPESPECLVEQVLEPMRKKLVSLGKTEWTVVNEWAASYLRIASGLEHFDIDYAIEQYNHTTSLPPGESILSDPRHERYLPMWPTIETIFSRVGALFDLSVKRFPPASTECLSSSFCLPRAFVFEVVDRVDGCRIGEVVVDIESKSSFSVSMDALTVVPLVTRHPSHMKSISSVCSKLSVAGLFGSLPEEASTFGLSEVEATNIAGAFGTCLQHVVSRTPSHMFTGISTPLPGVTFAGSANGIPVRDNFFLTHDLVILLLLRSKSLRSHVLGQASTSKPKENFRQKNVGSQNGISRIVALPMLSSLYKSRFDLEIWSASSKNLHWQTISERLWARHMPYARYSSDQWPCSAVSIFGLRGVPGLSYSSIWRQLIAFDCLAAFCEAGFEKDSTSAQAVFKRYRETVLVSGNSISSRAAFQAFRGRDPQVSFLMDALLPASKSVAPLSEASTGIASSGV